MPKHTAEIPDLEPELIGLWAVWRELNRARSAGGMGVNPLSYSEIEAYCRMTGEQLEPWEARAIRAVDDAYIASSAGGSEGDANG